LTSYEIDTSKDGIIYLKERKNWKDRIKSFFKWLGLTSIIQVADSAMSALLGWIWVPIRVFIEGLGWIITNRRRKIPIYVTN